MTRPLAPLLVLLAAFIAASPGLCAADGQPRTTRLRRSAGSFKRYVRQWESANGAAYPGTWFGAADECNSSHNATFGMYADRPQFYATYLASLAKHHGRQTGDLQGLEVGAMHNRAPVPAQCHMTYVDAAKVSDLLTMHPELKGSRIVEPDIVDNVETLGNVADARFDFVIASHLLEHARNFLQAVDSLLRVTKSGGMVLITLPNKCTTFDRKRLLTTPRHIFSEYDDPDTVAVNEWEHFREWSISNAQGGDVDAATVDAHASKFLKAKYHIHYHTFTADSLVDILAGARKRLKHGFDVNLVVSSWHEMRIVLVKT